MAVELPALTPQILLALTALAVLVVDIVAPDGHTDRLVAGVAAVGSLVAAGVAGWFITAGTGAESTGGGIAAFDGALVVDTMSLFFTVIVAAVTAIVVVASADYMIDEPHHGEYYSLLLLAATGMALLGAANSFATAFVALELASLPSYALVAFLRTNRGSVEGGLKYFLVGALSSAVFVYGVSLVYLATGSLRFGDVAAALAGTEFVGVLGVGVLMVVGGVAFKTASVPFHFWAPEAYEGAPTPISAFISSASKAAGFVLAFRLFTVAFPESAVVASVDVALVFTVLAAVTMTLGNFAAATQESVKRMLAYSSVGHAGYALIGLAALSGDADALVLGVSMSHLFVYGFMNTGAFLFVALAEHWGVGRTFEDYNGLATQAPVACVAVTVCLFSLAGLPVGAGFLSKYFILLGAVTTGHLLLAALLVVNSALSLFYYARVVKAVWVEEPADGLELDGRPTGLYAALLTATTVTVALLVFFRPVVDTATNAAAALV